MSTKYFALLTKLGADRLANAAALGTKIEITQMAVGDGGGSLPTPDTNQQKLINEKRRAAINVLSVDPKNTHQIIAEQVIPESEGGWWIREIGLFDKDGVLIAVGNCAETYKPQLQEGSGRTQTIRMVLIVSHTNAVTLKIDPSVVLATREYADASIAQAIRAHEQSRRHPEATLKEKGLVILSSAVDSQNEMQAATPRAVKLAYDLATRANQHAANANYNADTRLEKAKNGADVPNKAAFVNNIGAYPKTGGILAGNVDATGSISGHGVYEYPSIRVYSAVNKPSAGEIGALPASGTAVATYKLATARTIAGVPFDGTANIAIPAGHVGAYTKAESDNHYQPKGQYALKSELMGLIKPGFTMFAMQNEKAITPPWYSINGDRYGIDTPVGQVLKAFPADFKARWNMMETAETITLPNVLQPEGRMPFPRPVNGTERQPGSVRGDTIRNFTGELGYEANYGLTTNERDVNGVFRAVGASKKALNGSGYGQTLNIMFDPSTVVPTGPENKPLDVGVTWIMYLGV
ncbi:phage tail protein [Xenorhabdus sp. PB61.4]|uniref:phage tail protein n=1 Tax=Xenorhabdus sp. PB61.4 TaxID=2788940 RepID=UPI001E427D1A|nr:phage tail protein [Xenorhabdus sp. PB61.4]